MFNAIRWGGPDGEAARESRGVWGAARPSNKEKMVQEVVNTILSSQGKMVWGGGKEGGPGGEAPRESKGVWGAASPSNNSKSWVTRQHRRPGKISLLLGEIFGLGICKLPSKFKNLAEFLEPRPVLSERPVYVHTLTFIP